MRRQLITATIVALLCGPHALAAEETLQNDSFLDQAPVTFQAGFVAGEMAGARFVPALECPCVLDSVTLLFGGGTEQKVMGINIWEDPAGDPTPGALLFSGEVTLTGSNQNLQEIDLTTTVIPINGPFRVGIEFGHAGVPTVATDLDGNIDASANFIFADIGGLNFWFPATTLGVSGDFIIRATIDNLAAVDTDQDGIADEADNCTLVANTDQRDTNADGFGNACDGDLTNDCTINFSDIAEFSNAFLQSGDLDADLNGDGVVNFVDFSTLTTGFLMAPGPSGVPNFCDPINSGEPTTVK